MYRVFRWPHFDDQLSSLSTIERYRVHRYEQHFKEQPNGKPLSYPFFQEKRLNGKRMLFLVYEEERAVLLVVITDKKVQQQHINFVKEHFEEFRTYTQLRLLSKE
jgi:hypothetical protein